MKAANKKLKYEKISENKTCTSIEELCKSYPEEFANYFHYCRSLCFNDKPDYAYIKKMFRDLFIREGFQFDYVFDWTIIKYGNPQRLPTNKVEFSGARVGTTAVDVSGELISGKDRWRLPRNYDAAGGRRFTQGLVRMGGLEAFKLKNPVLDGVHAKDVVSSNRN